MKNLFQTREETDVIFIWVGLKWGDQEANCSVSERHCIEN